MGGGNAPAEIVAGAALAAAEYGCEVVVVGLETELKPLLAGHPDLRFEPASEVIGMDEHPAQAVRQKKDSSMSVCARLCAEGAANGWCSAGNSGAILAAALFLQGRIKGVERPALGSVVPTNDGFVGNIAIKMMEATAEFLFRTLRDELPRSLLGLLGGALIRGRVGQIRSRIDWREFGGAPLLGIDGVAVVAHGRSDARAMKNAIRVTRDAVENQLVGKIRAEVGRPRIQ